MLLAALGFISAGNKSVSSISTISTSPDWISAAPSHDIIIGIQSPPPEQFSGVCKIKSSNRKKKKVYFLFLNPVIFLVCVHYIYWCGSTFSLLYNKNTHTQTFQKKEEKISNNNAVVGGLVISTFQYVNSMLIVLHGNTDCVNVTSH